MQQHSAIIRRPARTLHLGRLAGVFLLTIAAAGLPGCDGQDPTGTDLTTSSTGAQVDASPAAVATDVTTTSAPTANATVGTLPLPLVQVVSSNEPLFYLAQTGTSNSGKFRIDNPANTQSALFAQSNGSGPSLLSMASGTGQAGHFEITNQNSMGTALEGRTQGSGAGVYGVAEKDGNAAWFDNIGSSNTKPAIYARNLGLGAVASFASNSLSNPRPAVSVEYYGTSSAIQAQARNGTAGSFENILSTNSKPALIAKTQGTNWAGMFLAPNGGNGVYIATQAGKAGLQVYGGTKNAVVPTPRGARELYSEEATEVWFTDYGFGKLEHGRARVLLDPSYAQTINPGEPYHVFVQPYGRAELYVTERTPLGFVVALKDGDPDAEFSYRIVAKRLGFEEKRLDAAPWADRLSGGEGQRR